MRRPFEKKAKYREREKNWQRQVQNDMNQINGDEYGTKDQGQCSNQACFTAACCDPDNLVWCTAQKYRVTPTYGRIQ